jgi:hypothetical protein
MRLALLVLAASAATRAIAAAETGRVLVVELVPGAAHAWPEADRHLRAELAQSELEVVALPLPEEAELGLIATVEREAREREAVAALMVYRDAASGAVRIWVIDRVTGKLVARTLEGGGLDPGEVALRAVELLHASLIEIRLGRPRGAPAAPEVVERIVERALATPRRWSAEVDLAVGAAIASDTTPALAVHVRARARAAFGLTLELAADTTATSMSRAFDAGRAEVSLAGLVGRVGVRSRGTLQVGGSLGAGVLFAWGEGEADAGWRGRDDRAHVAILDLTLEGRAAVTERLALALGLTARFSLPALSILDRTFARPLWLPSLALAWVGR